MKQLLVVGVLAVLLCFVLAKEIIASAAQSDMAAVKVEKFDPPAMIDEYNEIVRVLVVTNIPDTPHLVLHIPCIRSRISPNNSIAAGVVVAPGVVEGCTWQKIPVGKHKGAYVNANGEIAAVPGGKHPSAKPCS